MTPKEALNKLFRYVDTYESQEGAIADRCYDIIEQALDELEELKIKADAWDVVKSNIKIRPNECCGVVSFTRCTLDVGFLNYGKLQKTLEVKE